MIRIFFCLASLFTTQIGHAQDFHFSQFFNAPLTFNPALTGHFKHDIRVGGIYRSQWQTINAPFVSWSGFADMNIVKHPLKAEKLGIGIVFLNDDMTQVVKNQSVQVSFAMHHSLGESKRHFVSAGLMAGATRKTLDANALIFDNQIDRSNFQYNDALSSGESFSGNALWTPASSFGVNWDFVMSPKMKTRVGYSGNNLLKQIETPTLVDHGNRRGVRQNMECKLSYQLAERIALQPHIMGTWQAGAWESLLGGGIAYKVYPGKINPESMGNFGLWYRTGDAIVVYAGFRHRSIGFGFSYDATNSSLKNISDLPAFSGRDVAGAYEFSVVWYGFLKRVIANEYSVPCTFF